MEAGNPTHQAASSRVNQGVRDAFHRLFPRLWFASVADGQSFPYVAVWLVPVNYAAAMVRVDLHVDWTQWCASVLNTAGFDPFKDGVKLCLVYSKTIVMQWKRISDFVEVEGQAIVYIYSTERANAGGRPRHVEKLR